MFGKYGTMMLKALLGNIQSDFCSDGVAEGVARQLD